MGPSYPSTIVEPWDGLLLAAFTEGPETEPLDEFDL